MAEEKKPGEGMQDAGRKMQKAGCALTVAITVPLIGLVAFGWVGFAIGLLVAVVMFAGQFSS